MELDCLPFPGGGKAGLQRGDLAKRAALWELTTATSLLYSGADLLIMYHPEAAMALKRTIAQLMDQPPASNH